MHNTLSLLLPCAFHDITFTDTAGLWCGGGVIESVQSGVVKLNATPSGYGPLTRGCCVDGVSCAVLRGYRCVYDSQVCGCGRSAWVQGVSEWRGVMLVSLRVDVY